MEFKSAIFVKYLRSLYKVNLEKTNKVHATVIDALFKVFVQMEDDINQMNLEMCITTATGKWLDLWGEYFGIPRKLGETDDKYSVRIIAEIIEPKTTLLALRKAATRWVNTTYNDNINESEIEIYEPWRDLLVTSHRGAISYLGRLPDSSYWTHGVVDMAIPDSSKMSQDLILYLNTIKACGVQISWHTTMNWSVLEGYFNQDSVNIFIEKFYDLWLKRNHEIIDGFRISGGLSNQDENYNTPLSISGYVSGNKSNHFEAITYRDFEPFRFTNNIIQCSPIITMEDIAYFNGVEFEELTIQQAIDLELNGDRQIPNLDNTGLLFEEEIKKFLVGSNIEEITEELRDLSIDELSESVFNGVNLNQISDALSKDTEGLENFLNNWRKHNYFNKPLNTNPLSICAGTLKILIETDT